MLSMRVNYVFSDPAQLPPMIGLHLGLPVAAGEVQIGLEETPG